MRLDLRASCDSYLVDGCGIPRGNWLGKMAVPCITRLNWQ